MIDKIRQFIENIGQEDLAGGELGNSIFLEAENNGFLPYNTASVKIKAFNDRTKSQRLNNISVQWFRHFEGRNFTIDNVEDSYNFTSEDIGSKIVAVVTDNDRPLIYDCLTFGPVSLDPQCRVDLEQTFKSGRAIFEVQLPYKHLGNELLLRPPEYKDASKFIIDEIVLTPEVLTLVHSKGVNTSLQLKNLSFESVIGFPLLVQVNFKQEDVQDLDTFELRSLPSNRLWFYIKFFNRVMREDFVMLTKLFLEVKAQSYSSQLAIWEARGAEKGFFSSRSSGVMWNDSNSIGDLLLQLNIMRSALQKNVQYTKSVVEERDSLIEYSEGLERDLKTTLKDLKDVVVRQKLHDQIDLSRIEKVEESILGNEQVKNDDNQDRSRLSNNSLNIARVQKLQEENERLEKINKTLTKELNAFKQKRKEKIKSINQSINAINKELIVQAENLHGATNESLNMSLDVSKFLEQVNDKSLIKKNSPVILEEDFGTIRETKKNIVPISPIKPLKTPVKVNAGQIQDEVTKLAQQKIDLELQVSEMNSKLNELKSQIEIQSQALETKRNEDKLVHPYLETQFNELRRKIADPSLFEDEEENGLNVQKSEVFDADFCQTLKRMVKANRTELLNIENEALSLRVSSLIWLIRQEHPEKESRDPSHEIFYTLQNQIHGLKSESERLSQEIVNLEKSTRENEDSLRNQNQQLNFELDQLTQQNANLIEKIAEQSEQKATSSALHEQLIQKETEIANFKELTTGFETRLSELTNELQEAKHSNVTLNERIVHQANEIAKHREIIDDLQGQIAHQAELISQKEHLIKELNDQIAQSSIDSSEIREKISVLEEQLAASKQENIKHEEVINSLNTQLNEKEKVLLRSLETNKKLAEEVDRLQADKGPEDDTIDATLKDA